MPVGILYLIMSSSEIESRYFTKRAQAVAVGGDDQPLTGFYLRHDLGFKIRDDTIDRVLETLGFGKFSGLDLAIARVLAEVALVRFLQGGWRNIVAPAPYQYLFVAVFCGGFGLFSPCSAP